MSINSEIETIINSKIKELPTNELVTITRIHDPNHCDIKTNTNNKIEYLYLIGTVNVGDTALLVPLKNNKHIVIGG